jgi:hypothetical protein
VALRLLFAGGLSRTLCGGENIRIPDASKSAMRTTRQFIASLGCISLAAVAAFATPGGDIHVITDAGDHRTITGEQAEAYRATNAWLEARLKEVESVRVGSTYGGVAKHFKRDGGIAEPAKHRFVSILCPFLKIDVEFEVKEGVKARGPLAATAKVVSVSKPYFERVFAD